MTKGMFEIKITEGRVELNLCFTLQFFDSFSFFISGEFFPSAEREREREALKSRSNELCRRGYLKEE